MVRVPPANRLFASLVAAIGVATVLGADSQPRVADAAMRHDREAVRSLLTQGADVNAAQGDGMTALHWAGAGGDAELTSMLLYGGANVRATTRLGRYTPLHMASRGGDAATIALLLQWGADVNGHTSSGATPLMLAAGSGQVPAVTALLERQAAIDTKEATYHQTALMFAAAVDAAEVVRLLIAKGADPSMASSFMDLKDLGLPEPPTAAIGQGTGAGPSTIPPGDAAPRRGASRKLEVAGVTRPFRYNELIGGQGGLTALHFAAREGHLRSVQALVEGGANVNQVSPADHATPLLIATANGRFDIADYLLARGADPNLVNDAGVGPLYAAINVQWAPKAAYPQPRAHLQQQHTYLDLVAALLDHHADPNARLNRKVWFASYNFDQSNVDEAGATPLWRAAYAADTEAMALLVARGADPNIPTVKLPERRGPDEPEASADVSKLPPVPIGGPAITALQASAGPGYGTGFAGNSHHVAPTGMLGAVKFLVEDLHADVNAQGADGNTALHLAASRGDNEMILYLVSKGADVKAINRAGQTTVDVANGPVQRVQPFPETIALLEKLGAKNNHKCVSC